MRLYQCHLLVQSLMQTKKISIKASSASFYNGNGLVNLGSANSILGFDACHSDTELSKPHSPRSALLSKAFFKLACRDKLPNLRVRVADTE